MITKPCLLRDKHLVQEYFSNHYNTKKFQKINVIDILMGLKAKSSTLIEFCEKCMKSLWLLVYNANSERFFQNITL